MTTEIKSLDDAISAGIELANNGGSPPPDPAPAGEGEIDDSTNDPGAAPDAAGDTPAGDADGDKGDDSADRPEPDADGADKADGKDGDDAPDGDKPAADGKDVAKPDAKAGSKDGEPKPTDKKPDHYNDPIPNALKPATKERIRFLVSEAKTHKERAETAETERAELITAITDTGATPQQYSAVLDYLTFVNSRDRNKQIQAANFLIRELSSLSRIGGFRIPGITSYSGHKDLEEKVAAGHLTEELAEEIAASRAAVEHQGKVGAAQSQMAQQRQAYQQAETKAREDLNTLEAQFRHSDPMYDAKKPIIVEMLNTMINGDRKAGVPPLHPAKWAAAFKHVYSKLPNTAVAAPKAPVQKPANQPLRTQQPAGGQKPEPKSMEDAISMGIELARGG